MDEKARTATLTPHGRAKAEAYFGANLSDPENTTLQHHINEASRRGRHAARWICRARRQVIIVDEFTGRLMLAAGITRACTGDRGQEASRYTSKTLATITFKLLPPLRQAVRHDRHLTEEEEFRHIYKLDVIEIPTNRPVARRQSGRGVQERGGKIKATIARIEECHARVSPSGRHGVHREIRGAIQDPQGQGIRHTVLNAKYHEREADIVAQAGKRARSRSRPTWPPRHGSYARRQCRNHGARRTGRRAITPPSCSTRPTAAETDDPEVLAIREV